MCVSSPRGDLDPERQRPEQEHGRDDLGLLGAVEGREAPDIAEIDEANPTGVGAITDRLRENA